MSVCVLIVCVSVFVCVSTGVSESDDVIQFTSRLFREFMFFFESVFYTAYNGKDHNVNYFCDRYSRTVKGTFILRDFPSMFLSSSLVH